jgi:hypothetical protein
MKEPFAHRNSVAEAAQALLPAIESPGLLDHDALLDAAALGFVSNGVSDCGQDLGMHLAGPGAWFATTLLLRLTVYETMLHAGAVRFLDSLWRRVFAAAS